MSNWIKKLLAAVLALILTVSMVACGTTQTVIPNETVPKDGEQENAGVNVDQEVGEVSYPLQTDHTISIWCPSTVCGAPRHRRPCISFRYWPLCC